MSTAPFVDMDEDLDAILRGELLRHVEAQLEEASHALDDQPPSEALAGLLHLVADAAALGFPAMARVAGTLEIALQRCDTRQQARALACRGIAVLRAQLDEARGEPAFECVASFLALLADEMGVGSDPVAPGPQAHTLADVLLATCVVSSAHVAGALRAQRAGDGRPLGEILLSTGRVDAQTLGDALAHELAQREARDEETVRGVKGASLARAVRGIDAVGEAMAKLHAGESAEARSALGRALTHLGDAAASWGYVEAHGLLGHLQREGLAAARRDRRPVTVEARGAGGLYLERTVARTLGGPLARLVRHAVERGATTLTLDAQAEEIHRWSLRVRGVPEALRAAAALTEEPAMIALGDGFCAPDGPGCVLLDLPRW